MIETTTATNTMTPDIIHVNYENDELTISGRELHDALEVKTAYKDWFPRMRECGFSDGTDFNSIKIKQVRIEGKREVSRVVTDHRLTIDMAKEVCMIQRSDKGKQCRAYFLDLEKQWNKPEIIMARALKMAHGQLTILSGRVAEQEAQIEQMQPKAAYYDMVLQSINSVPISIIAKDYGKTAQWLNTYLHNKGIQYKRGNTWLLYKQYADQGYTGTRTDPYIVSNGKSQSAMHTCWAQKGRLFIYELLKSDNIIPTMELLENNLSTLQKTS